MAKKSLKLGPESEAGIEVTDRNATIAADKDNFISVKVSQNNDYIKLCNFLNKEPIRDKFLKLKVTKELEQIRINKK